VGESVDCGQERRAVDAADEAVRDDQAAHSERGAKQVGQMKKALDM
jgi:hypothetical protein